MEIPLSESYVYNNAKYSVNKVYRCPKNLRYFKKKKARVDSGKRPHCHVHGPWFSLLTG